MALYKAPCTPGNGRKAQWPSRMEETHRQTILVSVGCWDSTRRGLWGLRTTTQPAGGDGRVSQLDRSHEDGEGAASEGRRQRHFQEPSALEWGSGDKYGVCCEWNITCKRGARWGEGAGSWASDAVLRSLGFISGTRMKGFKKENKKLRVRHSGSSVMTGLGRGVQRKSNEVII